MLIQYSMDSLQRMLQKNVVEARFIRRHEKTGWASVRGAFITTNWELLNDELGYRTLGFSPPNGRGMGYNHRNYNLVVGWDLFRQDYRVFGVENSNILKFYDVSTPEARVDFWVFFRERIMQLTSREKLIYMGYIGNTVM